VSFDLYVWHENQPITAADARAKLERWGEDSEQLFVADPAVGLFYDALMEASGEPVTYAKIAAAANVSRAWLYSQPDIRAAVTRLRDTNNRSTGLPIPTRHRTSEASLVRRLEAAHHRNQELTRQIAELREQLAAAHGALRDSRTGRPANHTW
jgi:hypothetical protein